MNLKEESKNIERVKALSEREKEIEALGAFQILRSGLKPLGEAKLLPSEKIVLEKLRKVKWRGSWPQVMTDERLYRPLLGDSEIEPVNELLRKLVDEGVILYVDDHNITLKDSPFNDHKTALATDDLFLLGVDVRFLNLLSIEDFVFTPAEEQIIKFIKEKPWKKVAVNKEMLESHFSSREIKGLRILMDKAMNEEILDLEMEHEVSETNKQILPGTVVKIMEVTAKIEINEKTKEIKKKYKSEKEYFNNFMNKLFNEKIIYNKIDVKEQKGVSGVRISALDLDLVKYGVEATKEKHNTNVREQ